MSLNIDVDKVEAVLLADGWHRVSKGTFGLDAYEYVDKGDTVLPSGRVEGVPSTGAMWKDGDTIVACPVTAILAVRWKAPAEPKPPKQQTQRFAGPATRRAGGSLRE
jgi:hypothetical protein